MALLPHSPDASSPGESRKSSERGRLLLLLLLLLTAETPDSAGARQSGRNRSLALRRVDSFTADIKSMGYEVRARRRAGGGGLTVAVPSSPQTHPLTHARTAGSRCVSSGEACVTPQSRLTKHTRDPLPTHTSVVSRQLWRLFDTRPRLNKKSPETQLDSEDPHLSSSLFFPPFFVHQLSPTAYS